MVGDEGLLRGHGGVTRSGQVKVCVEYCRGRQEGQPSGLQGEVERSAWCTAGGVGRVSLEYCRGRWKGQPEVLRVRTAY